MTLVGSFCNKPFSRANGVVPALHAHLNRVPAPIARTRRAVTQKVLAAELTRDSRSRGVNIARVPDDFCPAATVVRNGSKYSLVEPLASGSPARPRARRSRPR